MKRKRYRDEQIIGLLKQHEGGAAVKDLIRQTWISEQTFYRWKSKCRAEEWRMTYNTLQLHGALNKKTPEELAAHARLRLATPPYAGREQADKEMLVGLTETVLQ